MNPRRRYWQYLSTEDFKDIDPEQTVALLPVGAVEQHGPHLPVYVDSCINQGIVERLLAVTSDDTPLLVLPMQAVGKSNEHQDFPGTLTLSAETLIRVWTEIGESVARAGVRKLIIFNSHGGQPSVMDIVASDLRTRLSLLVVILSWFDLGLPDGLFSADEQYHGIHGGEIETSIMLHLRPDLVRMEKAANFDSLSHTMTQENHYLGTTGPVRFAWQSQDINRQGVCGNAARADAERGEQVVDFAARALARVVEEVRRFPLERLRC